MWPYNSEIWSGDEVGVVRQHDSGESTTVRVCAEKLLDATVVAVETSGNDHTVIVLVDGHHYVRATAGEAAARTVDTVTPLVAAQVPAEPCWGDR